MRLYTIIRQPSGTLQLTCEAEVILKDQRGRSTGTKIETQTPSGPFDIGNASEETQALAAAVMSHYYGGDPEAKRKEKQFLEAFLIHANIPPNGKLEIYSNVIDRWASLL